MKRTKLGFAIVVAFGVAVPWAAAFAAPEKYGPSPKGSASHAAPSASMSVSPMPKRQWADEVLPRFADELPPPDPTPAPKPDDWKSATKIRFEHQVPGPCRLLRLREWVRVECAGLGAEIGVIAGNTDGFSPFLPQIDKFSNPNVTSFGAQFPLHRGDRRFLMFRRAELGDWDGNLYATDPTYVSATWIDGEDPMIVPGFGR